MVISIASDGKFERTNIRINTRHLTEKEKKYVRNHSKDKTIKWFTPRFLKKFPEYIKRLVEVYMHKDANIQIFLESRKIDLLINKIVDSAYLKDLMKGDNKND